MELHGRDQFVEFSLGNQTLGQYSITQVLGELQHESPPGVANWKGSHNWICLNFQKSGCSKQSRDPPRNEQVDSVGL